MGEKKNKLYEDCELKSLVLTAILRQEHTPQGKISARRIANIIDYQNTLRCLRSYLFHLKRRGLLSRKKINGLYHYGLTEKGKEHQANPKAALEGRLNWLKTTNATITKRAQELAEARFNDMIANDSEFMDNVKAYAEAHFSRPVRPIMKVVRPKIKNVIKMLKRGKDGKVKITNVDADTGEEINEEPATGDTTGTRTDKAYIDTIADLQRRLDTATLDARAARNVLARQEQEIETLNRRLVQKTERPPVPQKGTQAITPEGTTMVTATGRPLTTEEIQHNQIKQIMRSQKAGIKYSLVSEYYHNNRAIDEEFFARWAGGKRRLVAVKLIAKKWWAAGSIRILPWDDDEFGVARDHVRSILTPEQLYMANVRIIKYTKSSVEIMGRGFKTSQRLMFR